MHKCLTVAVICVLFPGCRETAERSDSNDVTDSSAAGRFVIPQDDLPEQIIALAGVLESLPSISSDSAFRVTLKNCGLNQKPDHFKDGGHFWFLDRHFKSAADPKKRIYQVAIGHFPGRDNEIRFYYARISRERSTTLQTLWEVHWPVDFSG